MSTIDSPAVARRRVRLALRAAREAKNLTQTQVAKAMEWSLSKVIRIEKGEVNISPGDLKVLLDYLDVSDPQEAQDLLGSARLSRQERYKIDSSEREHFTPAMIELMQFETEATALRYYCSIIVPGIIQTPDYARALFTAFVDDFSPETIDARVALRQQRQRDLLCRTFEPPGCYVILDESVLSRTVGDSTIMAAQFEHILRLIDDTPLQVRIMTLASTARLLASFGAFSLVDLEADRSALLYREAGTRDEVVHDKVEVARHRSIFDEMWTIALNETASADLISDVGIARMQARAEG